MDANNPKVFGTGFELDVITVGTIDIIQNDIASGNLTATTFTGNAANVGRCLLQIM